MKSVNLILFFSILSHCVAFMPQDCKYNVTEYHVEYICGVNDGYMFGRRTSQYLYCNNYPSGIKRGEIQMLSFLGCKRREIADNYLDVFTNLRVLNISFTEIETIADLDLKFSQHLERLISSNNRLTLLPPNLFDNTLDLVEVDFSYNRITKLEMFLFASARKLITVDLSFNQIERLTIPLFSNLLDLEVLDISNNRLKTMDNDLFVHNKKLKSLRLNNNRLKKLDCPFLMTFIETNSLSISLNTLQTAETSCVNNKKSIDLNIVVTSNDSPTELRIFNGEFEWIFNREDFNNICHLNLSSSHIENITMIMEKASPLLETLDLSNNFIGELHATTFEKFINLKNLNLRQTNVTNFEFATFYHQRNLQVLDISYNSLNKVDFYLFLRNFQSLESLNLEGNHLTEIDSVTQSHFPKLAVIGLSKNNFSCDYLVKFLLQWHDLKLIDSSSNRTHIGGVDCVHSFTRKELNINNVKLAKNIPGNIVDQPNSNTSYLHLEDLFAIKILLGLIFIVMCLFFITIKCKYPLKIITQRLMNSSLERSVAYNQKNHVDMQHGLLLAQQME